MTEQQPAPSGWEFRLSPDRLDFAVYDPDKGRWFVPNAPMRGQWVDSADMDRMGWTRYESAAAPSAPADRGAELAKHVTRAIHALKSPAPAGSEHYRSGWDDGLEAAIDAAKDALLRRRADETQQPAVRPSCPDPIECGHEAALGQAQQEIRRLGLMVDEYGAGASALGDKLRRVRDLHRETCILVRGEVKPTAFKCGMCEVLDAPADAVLPEPADRTAELSPAERTMLNYTLNQAQLRMWATGKFTDEDQAAVVSLRRLTAEAQQTAPWLSDSARIGRTLIWTWADIGKGVYGQGYRAAQAEARALLTGQRDSVEAQQPETQAGCGCPNENAVEHQFGTADCTCIPFVREGGTARYCQPGDTVDQISGWERGGDCPHHRPTAAVAQQPKEAAESRAVCVCGHTRGEHVIVGGPFGRGRLLCTVCNGLEGNACKEFEAL